MKNLLTFLAVTLFSAGVNLNAQETKPKESTKKEACAKEKKSCTKTEKSCCKAKSKKKA